MVLDDVSVGNLPDAVAFQVASAIDRGQLFRATIEDCWERENGVKCLRLRVEYLLEKGEPAIEVPKSQPVQQGAWKGKWETRYSRVAGVTYPNADGSDRQYFVSRCCAGERISLVREPDNPHDRFAVKVVSQDGKQLGYLPSAGVQTDTPWCIGAGMDEGYRYIVRVAGVGPVEEGVYGMSLQITFWNGPLATQPNEAPDLPPTETRSDSAPARSGKRASSTPQHPADGCFTILVLLALTSTVVLLLAR